MLIKWNLNNETDFVFFFADGQNEPSRERSVVGGNIKHADRVKGTSHENGGKRRKLRLARRCYLRHISAHRIYWSHINRAYVTRKIKASVHCFDSVPSQWYKTLKDSFQFRARSAMRHWVLDVQCSYLILWYRFGGGTEYAVHADEVGVRMRVGWTPWDEFIVCLQQKEEKDEYNTKTVESVSWLLTHPRTEVNFGGFFFLW